MSRFSRNEDTPGNVPKKTDECSQSIANTSNNEAASFHISELHRLFPHRRHCVRKPCRSVKEVVERFQNTSQNPIDLTSSSLNKAAQNPTAMLKCISIKYLKFAEDVRPPYIGTYSKSLSVSVASRLRKNPFSRSLPTTNYDYDSEAEWEDPGEGEDLESEGDEEAVDDEEGDEMDGFLDDEDVGDGIRGTNIKRRPLIGDLEPSSTGLCWENPYRTVTVTNTDAVDTSRLKCFRLELISGKN